MPAPDLSIVIVSFNTRELLGRCLASLPAAAGPLSFETIVVDNGSRDGSRSMVRDRFPDARLIEAGTNLGFARAHNRGQGEARGRIHVWLNPDCEMSEGSLAALHDHLVRGSEVGAAGPRLVYPDGTPQPSAQRFPSALRVIYHFLGARRLVGLPVTRWAANAAGREARSYLEALAPGIEPRSVDWVSGACLATRAEVVTRVGPLDEGYFMYCEDADWCHRVHDAGWSIDFLPHVQVVHYAGASGESNPNVTEHYYRSLLRYFRRYRVRQFALIRTVLWVAFVLRAFGAELAGRHSRHPWWRLSAACWSSARGVA